MRTGKRTRRVTLALGLFGAAAALGVIARANAADHGDAPFVSDDQATDIGDVYFFLDPTNNDNAVIALDVHGFIVPSENANLGKFDPRVRIHFDIENTGDAAPDLAIDVTFSRQRSRTEPQIATIALPRRTFKAPTTVSSATLFEPNATAAVVTSDPVSGVRFFAGLRDDPFFFDIPAELLYRASRFNNAIDPTPFARARDSFAGYNINLVALLVPVSLIQGDGNIVGVAGAAQRMTRGLSNIDRMGIPGVNTVFVGSRPPGAPGCAALDEPGLFTKDRYNRSTPVDDAAGVFADDIVKNLQCLRTGSQAISFFANTAVVFGDYLRLDVTKPNASLGVPTMPGVFPPGGFGDFITFNGATVPNGRRPGDDVIDIIVTGVNDFNPIGPPGGCTLNPAATCVDRIDTNDRSFLSSFPFFAPPHQPFPNTGDTDGTKN